MGAPPTPVPYRGRGGTGGPHARAGPRSGDTLKRGGGSRTKESGWRWPGEQLWRWHRGSPGDDYRGGTEANAGDGCGGRTAPPGLGTLARRNAGAGVRGSGGGGWGGSDSGGGGPGPGGGGPERAGPGKATRSGLDRAGSWTARQAPVPVKGQRHGGDDREWGPGGGRGGGGAMRQQIPVGRRGRAALTPPGGTAAGRPGTAPAFRNGASHREPAGKRSTPGAGPGRERGLAVSGPGSPSAAPAPGGVPWTDSPCFCPRGMPPPSPS